MQEGLGWGGALRRGPPRSSQLVRVMLHKTSNTNDIIAFNCIQFYRIIVTLLNCNDQLIMILIFR